MQKKLGRGKRLAIDNDRLTPYLVKWLIFPMQLEHLGNDVGRLNLSSLLSMLVSRSDRQCMVWLAGAFHDGDTDRMDGWKQSSMHELVSEKRFSRTGKEGTVCINFFGRFWTLRVTNLCV